MTFFENVLQKCCTNFDNTVFIGRAMYIPLGEHNRLKLQLGTGSCADNYVGIQMTVLDKNNGAIDTNLLQFSDVWGKKQVQNKNFTDGIHPHVWTDQGQTKWYVYQPTPDDYKILATQVERYADLFVEQQQGFTMEMQY